MKVDKLQVKSIKDAPDEVRPFVDKGHADVVRVGGAPVGRGIFEPGWKWSSHVKPIAKTPSCQAEHVGYVIQGRMKIVMDDGTEADLGPGDFFSIPSGHDAWVLGNERCELLDFAGFEDYAKPLTGIKAA
jgi:quercetin dioxygenase-like cupin family protein